MTPSPSSSCAGNAQSPSGASERPERSRNAKAQARHRAKRKAYIEQLEQTVVKLQTIMNLSPEQVAALPPPSVRIRELEQENQRLHHELDRVRRQLEHKTLQLQQFAMDRRIAFPNVVDRDDSRDYKRRRMSGEGAYLSPTESPRPVHESASRPSLHLPLPVSHPNAAPSPHASSQHSAVPSSNSIYPLEVHPFQMPDTPSGSTASSPSVSQPPRMMSMSSPGHAHSTNGHTLNGYASQSMHHMSAGVGSPINENSVSVPFYAQNTSSQYHLIKMEEDPYYEQPANQNHCTPFNAYGGTQSDMSSWPAYNSADRTQLQHRMNA